MSRVRAGSSLFQAKEVLVEMPFGGNELGMFGHPSKAGVASERGRGTPGGVRGHVWGFVGQGKGSGVLSECKGKALAGI